MRTLIRSVLTLSVCVGMVYVSLSSSSLSALSQDNSSPIVSAQISLTVEEITNYYLYGMSSAPTDLIDANLIRDPLNDGEFGASVPDLDMKIFMTSGPGRFIRGQHFELIDEFFTVEETRFTNNPDFEFGEAYSPQEIADFIGIDTSDSQFANASIQQTSYADADDNDDDDDFASRVYIFNSSGFTIAANAQFIVLEDGQRRIDNFTIRPFDDNFDFISDNYPTQIANYQLEDGIDPSTIGLIVDIPIRESDPLTESLYDYNENGYYDEEDYAHDNMLIIEWLNKGNNRSTGSAMETVVIDLWNDGIIKFLDEQNRPIIYGTNNEDILDDDSFGEPNTIPFIFSIPEDKQLRGYIDNGVVLIGGHGNDVLISGEHDDRLIGGNGDKDIAKFSGLCSEYDFTNHIDDSWTVSHTRGSQEDGTDTLEGIEQVQFIDVLTTLPTDRDTAVICTGQDITFVIDITGSMRDDIDAVKSEASNIIDAIFSEENELINSRIAIVGYRDPGQVSTILPFTEQAEPEDRKTAAINSINNISVGAGGDIPEGVYSGLLHALNGSVGTWRETALVRRIILFGDAPPKDYELANAVNTLASDVNVDIGPIPTASSTTAGPVPVEIFTIAIGSDRETAQAFRRIAEENSGRFFTANTAADVTEAVLDAVRTPPMLQPDLVIQSITATENNIQVVIFNQGTGPVPPEQDFWVDVYVNPDTPPTAVNDVWDFMGSEGLVWGVVSPAVPMQPGATLTLSIDDTYYWPSLSNFPDSIPPGTPIYAQVDSANEDSPYGGVVENHEATGGAYNNILGPVLSKSVEGSGQLSEKIYLPLITSSSTASAAENTLDSSTVPATDTALPGRP